MERAYAITSLPPERADAARLLEIWRGHWGIENRLHWVRDMVLWQIKPGTKGVGATTAVGASEPGIGILRLSAVKNISETLRHYGWKPWETLTPHRPTSQQLKDPAGTTHFHPSWRRCALACRVFLKSHSQLPHCPFAWESPLPKSSASASHRLP